MAYMIHVLREINVTGIDSHAAKRGTIHASDATVLIQSLLFWPKRHGFQGKTRAAKGTGSLRDLIIW